MNPTVAYPAKWTPGTHVCSKVNLLNIQLAAMFQAAKLHHMLNVRVLCCCCSGAPCSSNSRVPILFLHGVGAGLLPYIPFIHRLMSLGHPLIAVEYRHLAMRWTYFVPTVDEVAEGMNGILKLHNINYASFVAHSYGTFFASRLLQLQPHKVRTAQSDACVKHVCVMCYLVQLVAVC